jgi:hypothetical protein
MVKQNVAGHSLTALYALRSPTGDQVLPEDVTIISPYKDQVRLVDNVFNKFKVGYRDNLPSVARRARRQNLLSS